MTVYQGLRIAGAVAMLVLLPILARRNIKWRYLVYGPFLYSVLVLVFHGLLYFGQLSNKTLNRFSGWLGVLNMLNWLLIIIYKLRITRGANQ